MITPDYIKRVFANVLIRRIAYVLVGIIFAAISSLASAAEAPFQRYYAYQQGTTGWAYPTPLNAPQYVGKCEAVMPLVAAAGSNPSTYQQSSWQVAAETNGTCTFSRIRISTGVRENANAVTVTNQAYCPSGSTNVTVSGVPMCSWTTPECVAPAVRQPNGSCVAPPCPNGGSAGSGWVPDTPLSTPDSITLCVGGCNAYTQTIDSYGTRIENGQTNEYRLVTATYFGSTHPRYGSCSAGESPAASLPTDSCAAGQQSGTINGKFVCIDPDTGTVANTNPTKTTETTTTSPPVTNNDNSVTTTTTTTNISGGTTTTSTTVHPDGSKTTTISNQDGPLGPTAPSVDICKTSPNIPACKDEQVEGTLAAGTMPSTDVNFYESTYPDGISGIWDNFKSGLDQSSVNQALQSMVPNWTGGTCPTWSIDMASIGLGGGSLSVPCFVWEVIGIIFLVTALFTSRAIIFGG